MMTEKESFSEWYDEVIAKTYIILEKIVKKKKKKWGMQNIP